MVDVKVAVFLSLNATIPLTSTLGNEYPSSNETSKKNGTVRGDCITCDALFNIVSVLSACIVFLKLWYECYSCLCRCSILVNVL